MRLIVKIIICVVGYLASLPLAIFLINTVVHGPRYGVKDTLRQLGYRSRKPEQETQEEDIPDLDFFEVPPPDDNEN